MPRIRATNPPISPMASTSRSMASTLRPDCSSALRISPLRSLISRTASVAASRPASAATEASAAAEAFVCAPATTWPIAKPTASREPEALFIRPFRSSTNPRASSMASETSEEALRKRADRSPSSAALPRKETTTLERRSAIPSTDRPIRASSSSPRTPQRSLRSPSERAPQVAEMRPTDRASVAQSPPAKSTSRASRPPPTARRDRTSPPIFFSSEDSG